MDADAAERARRHAAGYDDASMIFVLKGDGWQGETTLATGAVDLRQMLHSGEEKLLVGIELKNRYGQQAGLLHASVVCLQALRLAWWAHARHEHIGLVAHGARLHPSAVQSAALGGPLSAWVEVELEGMEEPIGRSVEGMVAGVDVPLQYATELWAPRHSDHARALEAALRGPNGAPLTFRLYGRAAAAGDASVDGVSELGAATVRLRTLLGVGGDMMREALPLIDARGGSAGELRVSVLASEASARLFGVRSWAAEAIGLQVHAVTLDDARGVARTLYGRGFDAAASDGGGGGGAGDLAPAALWVEVDLMGLLPSATGLSQGGEPAAARAAAGERRRRLAGERRRLAAGAAAARAAARCGSA